MTIVTLQIVGHETVTLVPRILQIISRRDCSLRSLHTAQLEAGDVRLDCSFDVSEQWVAALPGLLLKLIDVKTVEIGNWGND